MGIIGFVIAGVIVGLLGKFLVPGVRDRVPLWLTILCGFGGLVIGWFVYALFGGTDTPGIDWVRWMTALVVAAILVLLVSTATGRQRARLAPTRRAVDRAPVVDHSAGPPAELFRAHIFLSYRRADALALAGRIADHLEQRFRGATVFYDVDSIVPGTNFRTRIHDALAQSQVLLAVVDKHWAGWTASGRRQLDEPGDFVALELRTAAELGVPVIPVIDPYATMPSAQVLPAELAWFADQHAFYLHKDVGFDFEMARLDEYLVRLLPQPVASTPHLEPPTAGPPRPAPVTADKVLRTIIGLLVIVVSLIIVLQLT